LSPLWRTFGLDVRAHPAAATIAICPPSLELPAPGAISMRPAPLPVPAPPPAGRPLVYLTLGTFSNSNLGVFHTVLDGLAGEPVDVIATVGRDNDPDRLRPWPANARIERFVPQAVLLPRCAAAVNHGGSGTMFGALAHGLGQLILPQSADNFVNADAVARAGYGTQLLPEQVTPASVADAVRTLLTDPRRARRAATEIAAMPGPQDVALLLHRRYS
jgi:MGT family glycosyltransferase